MPMVMIAQYQALYILPIFTTHLQTNANEKLKQDGCWTTP